MYIIKDAIYSNIKFSKEIVENILDSPYMQRLRRLKQIPFLDLIYPSANHTRFEHSLGVYHLTKQVASNNNIESIDLEIFALLHDVGHFPFSHTLEHIFSKHLGYNHEGHLEKLIKETDLVERISKSGGDPNKIKKLGYQKLGEIIVGDLGTDRIDYLLRDSYHIGKMLMFDYQYLLDNLIFKNKLYLHKKGLEQAESLLIFRFWMWENVYWHHTRRIISCMLKESFLDAIEKGLDVKECSLMDDFEFIETLKKYDNFWIHRVLKRKLFKRAFISKNLNLIREDPKKLQEEISAKANTKVLVDIPKPEKFREVEILVIDSKNNFKKLSEESPLINIITELWKSRWWAGIYCDKKNVSKVVRIARKILGE
jgi:hypothetical protein